MPRTVACPVCGNNSFNNDSATGERFSMAVAARASARGSPARIFSDQEVICRLGITRHLWITLQLRITLQELASDHQALDLAGTFADGAQLDVAIELFDG